MRADLKAKFLFIMGVVVFIIGLLPILNSKGYSFLKGIPLEGVGYNLIIAIIGLAAILISLSRERRERILMRG